jgi:hypothetical protein
MTGSNLFSEYQHELQNRQRQARGPLHPSERPHASAWRFCRLGAAINALG